jgi:cell division protein FtsB
MQEKIKSYIPKVIAYVNSLQDVRVAGQLVFVVIVLLISWSGVKAIQTNYGLQKQISALRQQTDVQHLKNNNLKLQNDYYNSNQYLELSARQNFGLALPGEKEIIVPESVALANTIDTPQIKVKTTVPDNRSMFERNLDSWMKFFLHRQ